ncbi:MAG TPA: YHS domain-containing protein [candidate division Zixibacteria bacterium]|nr:YHS domain-containing protein [candidate division Zixibacteria bacterium]
MATDPVCKMEVDEKAPPGGKVNYWGKIFYFCTAQCRTAFRRDPDKYAPEVAEGRGPGYDKARASETWRT